MLNIAFANLEWMIVLLVLAGSLLGSTFTYLGRRSVPEQESYFGVRANPYGYERPTDWPSGTGGVTDAAYASQPGSAGLVLSSARWDSHLGHRRLGNAGLGKLLQRSRRAGTG